MDIEQYLKENYRTVQVLDNGGYYCEDASRNALYIPPNYNGNMGMLSYLPGAGGSYNDAAMLRDEIMGDNPPDYIISISHTAYHDTAENLLTDTYRSLTENLNVNITDVCQMSFSASGGNGFTSLNNLLEAYPNVNTSMVVNNTGNDGTPVNHPERYQAIIENGTPIFYVDPPGYWDRERRVITGLGNGYNMYILESSSGSHIRYNRDILYNRFVDYLLGYSDEYGNESDWSSHPVKYNLVCFNPETGEKFNVDIGDVRPTGVDGIRLPNLKRLLSPGKFLITDNIIKTDDMGVLGSLTNLKLNGRGGEVSSKYSYVESAMNSIRSQVSSSGYLGGFGEQSFRSSEGIPGCIGKYLNAYFSMVNQLLTDLSLQTEAVLSYAQAMIDMDKHLAEGAEELGSIVEVPFEEGAKPQNNYKPPRKTPDYYGPSGNGDKTKPDIKTMKFKFEDNRKAVIEIEDNKISSFKYYYEYKTNEEAAKAYDELLKKYKDLEYFDKLEVVGNGINVYIKKEYLENKEFKEIEKALLEGAVIDNG